MDVLLGTIEQVNRDERFRRWEKLYAMAEGDPGVALHLREIAHGRGLPRSRYQRFVAAANVAGFGFPNQFGPNSISKSEPLSWYIGLHTKIAVPGHKTRRFAVDPTIAQLKILVPPNADNSLRFQEILWIILEEYQLDFRTDPDGTFHILPGERVV